MVAVFSLRALRQKLSHASAIASADAGNPWHPLVYRCIVPTSASVFTSHLFVSVFTWPSSYRDSSHIGLNAYPKPVLLHFSLTNYICNDFSSK